MSVGTEVVDIYSPDTYVPGPPHETFEHLRRIRPVYWQDMPDGTGYWAILKHADVVHVARLEGNIFFEELLETFPSIELTGEPRRTRSNLNNALKELPVRLRR